MSRGSQGKGARCPMRARRRRAGTWWPGPGCSASAWPRGWPGREPEVTLLEQDQPGQAATRSSFAWLNSNDKAPRAYHDLNHAGMRAWERLAGSLGGAAWYRPAGNLEWAASCRRARGTGRAGAQAHRAGYPARLISAAEAAELEPSLRLPSPAPGVAWFPGEGYLLTEAMVTDLLKRAAGHGGRRCWPARPAG